MAKNFGTGVVNVQKLRKIVNDNWSGWKYRATSSNRCYADGTEFSGADYSNLTLLAEDILKLHDKDERIVIVSEINQFEREPRVVVEADGENTWQLEQLGEDESAQLGKLIYSQKKAQLEEIALTK